MKPLRGTKKFNFTVGDCVMLAAVAVTNVAFGAYLIKRSYFEGFNDYEETFVNFKSRN